MVTMMWIEAYILYLLTFSISLASLYIYIYVYVCVLFAFLVNQDKMNARWQYIKRTDACIYTNKNISIFFPLSPSLSNESNLFVYFACHYYSFMCIHSIMFSLLLLLDTLLLFLFNQKQKKKKEVVYLIIVQANMKSIFLYPFATKNLSN